MHLRVSAAARPDWPQMVIGFPMLPESHRGQLAQCAAGVFTSRMRAVRAAMIGAGRGGQFIRLGWEPNRVGSQNRFPWAATGDGRTWVGCWRRWAAVLNPPTALPEERFKLVWNMANRGTWAGPIDQLYPGDDVVDVVGSQFFDRCPPIRSEAEFRFRIAQRDPQGNPGGPQAWMEYARTKGKPWALPEWGIGGSQTVCARPGFDNADLIRWMHAWLTENSVDVAFESYFNGVDSASGSHVLFPVGPNPLASAAYQEIWRQ